MARAADAGSLRKRWQDAMTRASTKDNYIGGINGTQVNPMELAANADEKFLNRVTESVTSGRRKAALLAVPKSYWQGRAVAKADRLSSGAIGGGGDKYQLAMAKWAPLYQQAKELAAGMPNNTEDDAINKVAAVIKFFKQHKGRR